MSRNVIAATVVSLLLGLAMIGGVLYWQFGSTSGGEAASGGGELPADDAYTVQELSRYDGQNGNRCLVAVDGNVYLIEGFDLWQNGQHIPSGGRATCGRDLTDVIDESPHGRSKLELLRKVGTLQ